MSFSQQSRIQNLSGYSPQVTTWSNTLGSTQNATIERASEDSQVTALREILTSFRTEISSALPSLSQQPASKERIEKRLGLLESQIDGLLRKTSFKSTSTSQGVRELDYSALLLEKENQIVNLQRRINVL
jgi:hypothetical protein